MKTIHLDIWQVLVQAFREKELSIFQYPAYKNVWLEQQWLDSDTVGIDVWDERLQLELDMYNLILVKIVSLLYSYWK